MNGRNSNKKNSNITTLLHGTTTNYMNELLKRQSVRNITHIPYGHEFSADGLLCHIHAFTFTLSDRNDTMKARKGRKER